MMDGFEATDASVCGPVCHCLMWVLICLTCPISLPLMAAWWCCQEICPVGPDALFGLGEGEESTNFANVSEND